MLNNFFVCLHILCKVYVYNYLEDYNGWPQRGSVPHLTQLCLPGGNLKTGHLLRLKTIKVDEENIGVFVSKTVKHLEVMVVGLGGVPQEVEEVVMEPLGATPVYHHV